LVVRCVLCFADFCSCAMRVLVLGFLAGLALAARRQRGNSRDLSRVNKTESWSHGAVATSAGQPNHIICPVLAAMHRAGDLKSDSKGNVEYIDMSLGLQHGLGFGKELAQFQAVGITDFALDQLNIEKVRDRCLPLSASGAQCLAGRGIGSHRNYTKRFFNIFTMNGKQTMEHGISTGTRGGGNNMPDEEDPCGGAYPCEALFKRFYLANVESNGRMYRKNIMKMVCMARQFGDRGGEFSYHSGNVALPGFGDIFPYPVPMQEWQMKGATTAMLEAFGWFDEHGELYLTVDDLRALMIEGRYPDGWKKKTEDFGCLVFGCSFPALSDFRSDVGECEIEECEPFWQNSNCQVTTGSTCAKTCSSPDEVCINEKCYCGRDTSGKGMCFKGGKCSSRSKRVRYFGGDVPFIPATGPGAPGNPK